MKNVLMAIEYRSRWNSFAFTFQLVVF